MLSIKTWRYKQKMSLIKILAFLFCIKSDKNNNLVYVWEKNVNISLIELDW